MFTADVVDREAAYLATSGDGLPALLRTDGGPWDVVAAYWPRTPVTRQSGIYLTRATINATRFANQRRIESYDFRGKLRWPIGATTVGINLWEDEQRAFDAAIELLITRIYGFLGDHTHGGRFLSVAEAPEPGRIVVHFDDPEHLVTLGTNVLSATITYAADDRDFTA